MEGENRVYRLKIQRLESRKKTRDIYKVVGCLIPYRQCLDISSAEAQLGQVHATTTIVMNRVIFCEYSCGST
jgi:hypothetical protein